MIFHWKTTGLGVMKLNLEPGIICRYHVFFLNTKCTFISATIAMYYKYMNIVFC